ncbi:hypothetical protein HN51_047415 [Arachis hypogaea]
MADKLISAQDGSRIQFTVSLGIPVANKVGERSLLLKLRYPEICIEFKYDPSFPIQGLYYDKSKGCLMKLDFIGSIEPDGCYFGRRRNHKLLLTYNFHNYILRSMDDEFGDIVGVR